MIIRSPQNRAEIDIDQTAEGERRLCRNLASLAGPVRELKANLWDYIGIIYYPKKVKGYILYH